MPELKCNPCAFCGHTPYPPSSFEDTTGKTLWTVNCYEHLYSHAVSAMGRTEKQCVENWNRLNPITSPDGQRGRTPFLQQYGRIHRPRRRWTLRDLWDLWTKGRP